MKKRNVCMLLAAALSCSLLLTACGGGGTSTTTPGTSTPSTSTSAPAGSGGASTGAESGYTFRTSESNRVVTESGTFTKDQVSRPRPNHLLRPERRRIHAGRPDEEGGAEYTFDATASAEDAAGYKTIIIASGPPPRGWVRPASPRRTRSPALRPSPRPPRTTTSP